MKSYSKRVIPSFLKVLTYKDLIKLFEIIEFQIA